jgi:hypothetical protein
MTIGGDVIGEATDHDSLVAVLRQRKAALALSDAIVDELAGPASGHCYKVIGAAPVKALGKISLSALLAVLGIKLVIVEDPDQVARIGKRWQRKSVNHVQPNLMTIGQARPVIRQRDARKAALKRWAGKTAAERRVVLAQVRAAKAAKNCARTDDGAAA